MSLRPRNIRGSPPMEGPLMTHSRTYGRPAIEERAERRARRKYSHADQRKVCQLLDYEPPHCGGEHGQEDNWHPYEPGRAGIFSAHSAVEQREAG